LNDIPAPVVIQLSFKAEIQNVRFDFQNTVGERYNVFLLSGPANHSLTLTLALTERQKVT